MHQAALESGSIFASASQKWIDGARSSLNGILALGRHSCGARASCSRDELVFNLSLLGRRASLTGISNLIQ